MPAFGINYQVGIWHPARDFAGGLGCPEAVILDRDHERGHLKFREIHSCRMTSQIGIVEHALPSHGNGHYLVENAIGSSSLRSRRSSDKFRIGGEESADHAITRKLAC
jgi:hypothetical protein